jgi:SAM-dependent methyltransferase
MLLKKWREVWERLPVERKNKSLAEISGYEQYCTDFEKLQHAVFNNLLENSKLKPNGNVCEVGCGCGDKLVLFNQAGYKCSGVDYSSSMIDRVKKEIPTGDFHVSEASILPFPSNSMDLVFSYGVFFYFDSWAYAMKALEEMYRIAKPQATICVWDVADVREQKVVESFRGAPQPGYEHTYFDMNDFMQWFKNKGCSQLKTEYFSMPFYKLSAHRFNVTAVKKG